MNTKLDTLLTHIEATHDDAYLREHPEWNEIVKEARGVRTPLTPQDIEAAATQLSRSDAGRQTLRCLNVFFHGKGLDVVNQKAMVTLLGGFWGAYSGTTLDAIDEALETDRVKG